MRGGTLFSGIGAPEVAAPWVNWRWSADIAAFPNAVRAHHWPRVPNLGDVSRMTADAIESVDLMVFGSPCQSFSIAGKRLGLDDPRGNLALVALRLVAALRPRWFVFENVPGILSSDGGRDFGTFLRLVGQCGYGFAYRVLDARFTGVPQRRRRVFFVGHLGDWRRAGAVLLERESLRWNPAPGREAGEDVAQCVTTGTGQRYDPETETLIPHVFDWQSGGDARGLDLKAMPNALQAHQVPALLQTRPRRLTPRECERLQGFPDDFTRIPWRGKPADQCPDAPRYKAMGNSMAVPCIGWVLDRIRIADNIMRAAA